MKNFLILLYNMLKGIGILFILILIYIKIGYLSFMVWLEKRGEI